LQHFPARRCIVVAAALVPLLVLAGAAGQTPSPTPLTLLSKDGRRTLPVYSVAEQEFVALDDLAGVFQLAVHDDALGAITVSYKGKTIVLTPEQALASVPGRLISLPAPPSRAGGPAGQRWLVPVEFISRALAPIYDVRVDFRKPSHLLVVGDLRVPRVIVRYDAQPAGGRLTLDATPRTPAAVTQDNERLSIRFDADALDLALPSMQPAGLVQGVRAIDSTTLAVDLGPRFASFRASTQAVDASSRLTIDIAAAQSETAPNPPPVPTPQPPAPPELTGTAAASAIRTIAIDAGHGGDDAGVVGPGGTKEKDLTLAVARRLKTAIESRLGIRVLLTRDEDRNVPIDERTATANHNKADVFVSLHANGSLRPRTAGASILYASFDKGAEEAARASLGTERVPTFGGGTRDIELVLWDLAQTRYIDRSSVFARILEHQIRGHVPMASRAVDRAPLLVLESANMPAVLVEMGYLTNPDQERQLTGNEVQNALVQSIVDALLRFRDALGGQT
jgi:N-acetylmuramoyl-L-alanine amidase